MNSESGKPPLGSEILIDPFIVLKVLGCGVFGNTAFNRGKLQLLRST